MAHIVDLQRRINTLGNETSNARSEQYQRELDLAREILAVRSTTEDSSFSFMSGEIPGGQ